jgi:hypothetical protein
LREREDVEERPINPASVLRRAGEVDDEVAVAPDVGPVLGAVLRGLPWVVILAVFAFTGPEPLCVAIGGPRGWSPVVSRSTLGFRG